MRAKIVGFLATAFAVAVVAWFVWFVVVCSINLYGPMLKRQREMNDAINRIVPAAENPAKLDAAGRRGLVDSLVGALADPDFNVRLGACDRLRALAYGYPDAEVSRVVPALTLALGDPDERVLHRCAGALSMIGPAAAPAVPALAARLPLETTLPSDVVYALVHAGPAGKAALVKALGSPSATARDAAAFGLAQLGADAADALPALEAAAAKEPYDHGSVHYAIMSIEAASSKRR